MSSVTQAFQQAVWWQEIPWLYITVFFTGMTAWEILDPNSDIRKWLRNKTDIFTVVHFIPKSTNPSSGIDTILPTIKIRLLKTVSSNIIMSVDTIFMGKYKRQFSQEILPQRKFYKDTEHDLTLATIHKATNLSGTWEAVDDLGVKRRLCGLSKNLVTIKIGKQCAKFYIEHIGQGGGCCGVCYLQSENEDIWNIKD